VDVLEAGRADAPRLLRPPPRATSHSCRWLIISLAVAPAAHGRAAPRATTRRDRWVPPPWPAYKAAIAWLSPCRWSAQAGATPAVSWYVASRN